MKQNQQPNIFQPQLFGFLLGLIASLIIALLMGVYDPLSKEIEKFISYKSILIVVTLLVTLLFSIILYYRFTYHSEIVWRKINSKYDLKEISPGIRVWTPNQKNKIDDPNLWLCPVCFADHKISPLQMGPGIGLKQIYKCLKCDNEIRVHK
jgi:hypothetical protein